ncbi:MAG: GTP 3',8-cyclase MoaA [Bacteriovoracaceae bacterium]
MEALVSLIDQHGRKIRKLRLSLTDKCNLRCHYCMPIDSTFMDEEKYLSPEDYSSIVSELCDHGLEELRLTGGEPLLRKNFEVIIERLSRLPLRKIGLTTNGIFLDRYLEILKANRVHHLNISLDSLKEENFRKITYGNHLKKVLANIELAQKMNFHIKLNVVAMRGVNDHELLDFVEYSKSTGIEVRFLELMRIGFACGNQADQFISASELISNLQKNFELKAVVKEMDSTSFNYLLSNGAQIGFIASESKAFCGQCSRWRLSADGILRACLLKDDGITIKNTNKEQREDIYRTLLGMKPFERPVEVAHHMNAIGG